jgi:hypothetical protein
MLKKSFLLSICVLLMPCGLFAQAQPSCVVVPKTFAAMHHCYRPLLVFAPRPSDPRLTEQEKMLDGDADDMMDRFVLFTPVTPDGRKVNPPLDAPWTILPQAQMDALRKQFHIPLGDFVVLLVDEDGSIMFRTDAPVNPFRLNRIIDRTPLRQREMLRKDAN